MSKNKSLTADEIVKSIKDKFKNKIKETQIKTRGFASKKKETSTIWMKVEKDTFKPLVKHLVDLTTPHLAVASGNDLGKTVELIYHFTINFGERLKQVILNISIEIPKTKLEIESICDLIPGALITEREKMEMLGVKIIGIPDNRRVFVPEDFPEGVFPWRRDETGPEKYYKNLHEVKK